jgi:GDPmannose 4,6-dehydratase
VIATGRVSQLEDFVALAFAEVRLDWRDHVVIDQSLFRATDVIGSPGNATKARQKLGWQAKYLVDDIVRMMVEAKSIGNDIEA